MVQVFKNYEELSVEAARNLYETAIEAVAKNGRFTVALTGGSSPHRMYELLAQPPYLQQMPWSKTFIFWGDERWVPLTDEKSNAKMTSEKLLSHVPVPPQNIFPMWKNVEPEVFAMEYEATIKAHFGNDSCSFDLVLLGMGDDGHTASLFPNTNVLHEQERLVTAYYLEPQSMYRITLTAPCINAARKIICLVNSHKKADALYEVLEGEANPEKYPAQLIKPTNGEVIWMVDQPAAQRLTPPSPY